MDKLLLFILAVLLQVFVGGFVVMLTAGGLHAGPIPEIPAWSYGDSIMVSIGLTVVGGYFQSSNYSRS